MSVARASAWMLGIGMLLALWALLLQASGCGPATAQDNREKPIVNREVVRHLEFKSGTLIIVNTVHVTGEANTAITWAPRYPTCNCP